MVVLLYCIYYSNNYFLFLYLNYNARLLGINKAISSKFVIIEPNFCLPFIKSYRLTKFKLNTIYFPLILFRGIHNITRLILHP